MNGLPGVPAPLRNSLTDGCFKTGASSDFLNDLVLTQHIYSGFTQDIPWDFYDLSRCIIFMLKCVGKNRELLKAVTINLSNVAGLSPYWKTLLSRWDYLTNEVIYSNRLSKDVINCMLILLRNDTVISKQVDYHTFMYINQDTSMYTAECIKMAKKEIEEQWLNHNESKEESYDSNNRENDDVIDIYTNDFFITI